MRDSPRKSVVDGPNFGHVAGAHRTRWEGKRKGPITGGALDEDA